MAYHYWSLLLQKVEETAFRKFRQRNWWIKNYKSNKQVDTTQAVEAIMN